jgi:hypothetical protein
MEIDFSDVKFQRQGFLIVGVVILAALLMGILGWYLTPQGQVLTWTEWQVYKQHSQYQRELHVLTRHADRLAALLEKSPDPVRAQLVIEQMAHELETNVTLVTLSSQTTALSQAGSVVMQWALGSAPKDAALTALDTANQTIMRAIEQVSK